MTITRLWQLGFESNGTGSLAEFDNAVGTGGTISATYAKTGTYSFRCSGGAYGEKNIPATRQVRLGVHVRTKYNGSNTYLIALRSWAANLVSINQKDNNNLSLIVGTTEYGTCAFAVEASDFKHIGLDVKIDSSAGWAVVYIDGVEAMRYEGNIGNADISLARLNTQGGDYQYFDDCFCDDTTSQGSYAPVPDRRFMPITPNGAGAYNHGIGSDGDSVNNYLLVDDRPHNSDTDYVYLDALDEKELNLMTTYAPPTGFTFAALIPFVYAKKTDAEVGTQLAPLLYTTSGSDLLGTAQNLPTSYTYLWGRFTTKPGGGAWDQAAIDDVQVGFQGKGTF
jgi:hypothetical protein